MGWISSIVEQQDVISWQVHKLIGKGGALAIQKCLVYDTFSSDGSTTTLLMLIRFIHFSGDNKGRDACVTGVVLISDRKMAFLIICRQIEIDSEFLMNQGMLDYSLLLGFHYQAHQSILRGSCPESILPDNNLTVLLEQGKHAAISPFLQVSCPINPFAIPTFCLVMMLM